MLGNGLCVRKPKEENLCNRFAKLHDSKKQTYKFGCLCPEGLRCKLGEEIYDKVFKCRPENINTTFLKNFKD